MTEPRFSVVCLVVLFVMSVFNTCPSIADPWSDVSPVDLFPPQRGEVTVPGESVSFTLEIPSVGLLVLQVTASGAAAPTDTAEPVLEILGEEDGTWMMLDHTAKECTVAVLTFGTLQFQISPQDPSRALGAYSVAYKFINAQLRRQIFDLPRMPTRLFGPGGVMVESIALALDDSATKTELEEVDPNPGGRKSWQVRSQVEILRLTSLDGSRTVLTKTELEEVDPNPGGLTFVPRVRLQAVWWHHGLQIQNRLRSQRARMTFYLALPSYGESLDETVLEKVSPEPRGRLAGERSCCGAAATIDLELSPPNLTAFEERGKSKPQAVQQFLEKVERRLAHSLF